MSRLLAEIGEELQRRLEAPRPEQPELVLVVDEWAELPECGPTLDLLARHGPAVGMHLIAATAQVEDPRVDRAVGLFGTRLVLHVPDEAASVRLLGQAGAEELDRVGQALPLVDGEVLPRVRGFSVPPAHVQDLVARMHAQIEREAEPSIFEDIPDEHDHPAQQHATADQATASTAAPDVQDDDAVDTTGGGDAADDAAVAYRQAPLIGAVPMPPSATARPAGAAARAPVVPPVAAEFFGQDRIAVAGRPLGSTAGVIWDLFRIVCCLRPGKASLACVAALLYPADDDRKAAIQRLRQSKSNLQKAWASIVGEQDARRLLIVDDGVLWLDPDLVSVDVHAFLAAIYEGNRARKAGRMEEAIAAYRRTLALYAGPLLAGRDEDYAWLGVPVEGTLTLREAHRHQERVATERLAELLVAAGRPAEAAPLYADLMRDPGPPNVEADELEQFVFRQYAFREECARAVFECCRLTGDLPGLRRAYQELREVLRALAADAGVALGAEGTEPGAVTQARYEAIYAELTRGNSSAAGD